MSSHGSPSAETAQSQTHAEPNQDSELPSEKRCRELQASRTWNLTNGRPPYQGVHVTTCSELQWIVDDLARLSGADKHVGKVRANLKGIDLSKVNLSGIDLSGADLSGADLSGANLSGANLRRAAFIATHLHGATLERANLARSILTDANLRKTTLDHANMEAVHARGTDFTDASLIEATLTRADLSAASFRRADLSRSDLSFSVNVPLSKGSNHPPLTFWQACLSDAVLQEVSFDRADFRRSNLRGADLTGASLKGADLRQAHMDVGTVLDRVKLDERDIRLMDKIRLADVTWNGVPLQNIDWGQLRRSGDEGQARMSALTRRERINELAAAARAYHGLRVALQEQGLSESATRFRIKELDMRLKQRRHERRLLRYGFWWVLKGVCGYGERPLLTGLWYIVTLALFTVLYFIAANGLGIKMISVIVSRSTGFSVLFNNPLHLSLFNAFIYSVLAFHGRGLYSLTTATANNDPVARLSSIEAFIGLFIEAIFIATFTRRFLS